MLMYLLPPGLMCIKEMDVVELRRADMPFSVPSSTGQEVHLSSRYARITLDNRAEYIRAALNYRYAEIVLRPFYLNLYFDIKSLDFMFVKTP